MENKETAASVIGWAGGRREQENSTVISGRGVTVHTTVWALPAV